jgi:glycosyltransferase involved in cell wall biosynthesis
MSAGRVWINARFLSQAATGVQRFAEQITRQLITEHPEVTVVAPPLTEIPDWLPQENVFMVGKLRGHAWEQIELPRALKRAGSPLLLNLASTAPIRYRNQISTHHDITYVRYPTSFSRSFRLLYSVIVPRFLKASRAVITVSEFSRQEIACHYKIDVAKIVVVANAADSRFRVPHEPTSSNPPYILAVSSPNEHKNFKRLLRAYATVATELSSDLVIIGKQTSSFAAQEYEVTPADRVRFAGRVPDSELIELYQGARAFIFPSLYEGFGIPPVEAQRCGVPVASSNAASLPEVLGTSALFFDPTDERAIAEALLAVDSDPSLRARLRQAGLSNAERFSWASSASRVWALATRPSINPPNDRRQRSTATPAQQGDEGVEDRTDDGTVLIARD